jgi:hypothetical protein
LVGVEGSKVVPKSSVDVRFVLKVVVAGKVVLVPVACTEPTEFVFALQETLVMFAEGVIVPLLPTTQLDDNVTVVGVPIAN